MSAALTEPLVETIVVPMITLSEAIDLFDGDLARRGRSSKTRKNYRDILWKLEDRFPRRWDINKVTEDDCNAFLDLWAHRSLGTQGQVYAAVNGLFRFLRGSRRIKTDPMEFIYPPRRLRPEDLPVTTISTLDVPLMLEAARPGTELNCVAILAYLGPRRHAVALLRVRDYDRRTGELRFQEKGRKEIWKPVPDQLRLILDESIKRGDLERPAFGSSGRDAYLVPPEGWLQRQERDDRIVWSVVKRVADRVGIAAHVHALRAAFACFYLESNPGDMYGLQELLGHESAETTRVYLRRFDRRVAMQPVRTLAWLQDSRTGTPRGVVHRGAEHAGTRQAQLGNTPTLVFPETAADRLATSSGVGAGGFEPPLSEQPPAQQGSQPKSLSDALSERIQRERAPR